MEKWKKTVYYERDQYFSSMELYILTFRREFKVNINF